MDNKKLRRVFDKIRKETDMDYVIFNTEKEFGYEPSMVLKNIGEKYGYDATGIFLKHWRNNSSKPWAETTEEYINHDITEEQAKTIIKIFKENGYEIIPEEYDETKCFCIKEKQ